MSGLGGSSDGSGGDPNSFLGNIAQWLAMAGNRWHQEYADLGLGSAGPSQFPAGTPFAGTFSGYPPGTPTGTISTPEQVDVGNLNLQGQGAFAGVSQTAQQIANAQSNQNQGAAGLLAGLGGGGGGGGTGLPNLGGSNISGA